MTKTMRNLAYDLDFAVGGISLRQITLKDIETMLSHLREDADNVKPENVAAYFIHDFHMRIRVLADLMFYTMKDFNEEFEELEGISGKILNRQIKADATKNTSASLVKDIPVMSPERDREVAMMQNTKVFMEKFNRAPKDQQEVSDWVAGLVAKLDPVEEKKPSSDGNQNEGKK